MLYALAPEHPPTTASRGPARRAGLRVLMATSEWPTPDDPHSVPFLVHQVEFLREAGHEVDVFAFRGAKNPLNYLSARRRLRARLRSGDFDLVHAQFGQAALLALPKQRPLVVTFHGVDILGDRGPDGRLTLPGRLLRRLSRLVARRADAVIIVADHMRPLLPAGVEPHLLPTGVDLDALPRLTAEEARARLGLPLDRRLVLFVGDPENHEKRHPLAEAAVALVPAELRADLVVGWNRPHREIMELMCACDAYVMSSLQEGSPTVVKEALASGLPVVSVPVGDVEVRLRGIDGCVLCADDRPETIATALAEVLRRGERIDAGQAARDLDERVLRDRLVDVYRSVLAPPQPVPSGDGGVGRPSSTSAR